MSTQNIPKAVAYMTGAIGSFSAMAVAGREVSFELDTFEIMMYRSFVGIAVVLALGWYFGTCLLYTSPSPRDLSTSRMPSSA